VLEEVNDEPSELDAGEALRDRLDLPLLTKTHFYMGDRWSYQLASPSYSIVDYGWKLWIVTSAEAKGGTSLRPFSVACFPAATAILYFLWEQVLLGKAFLGLPEEGSAHLKWS
jgi:hypothetical protein